MFEVQIVILCGGEGTRIRHITGDVPKCVYEINGRPFLYYVMSHFLQYRNEILNFILCCSDKSAQIKKRLLKCSKQIGEWTFAERMHLWFDGKKAILVSESKPTGTMTGMLSALPYVSGRYVLVLNGDTYCPINLPHLINFHQESKSFFTVVNSNGRHSGVWLVNSPFFWALQLFDAVNREGLLVQLENHREEELHPHYYTGPSFIDIGTPEGLVVAQQTLKENMYG